MDTPKITVAIRKRPLTKKETQKGETDIVKVYDKQVCVTQLKQKVDLTKYIEESRFTFDFAFDEACSNEDIYLLAIKSLISSAFDGAKVSCFAYGQTGSGKTFTMKGEPGSAGLYALAGKQIFDSLRTEMTNLKVSVNFFEIYCGKLYDLLNKRNELTIREDNKQNINVIGLEEIQINSEEEFLQLIEYGSMKRVTSQNAANLDSSRSHAILQITLKDQKKIFSKISFIDLAGNQRGADHMDQNRQTRIDGAEINKSLLALKECIRALALGKSHIPFRGSKLTMILKDSFVGYCKTVMIGNVNPTSSSAENTMNTLRYADRVKELKKPQQLQTEEETALAQLMLPHQQKNLIQLPFASQDGEDDSHPHPAQIRGVQSPFQPFLTQNSHTSSTVYTLGQQSTGGHHSGIAQYANRPELFKRGITKQRPIEPAERSISRNKRSPVQHHRFKPKVMSEMNFIYNNENSGILSNYQGSSDPRNQGLSKISKIRGQNKKIFLETIALGQREQREFRQKRELKQQGQDQTNIESNDNFSLEERLFNQNEGKPEEIWNHRDGRIWRDGKSYKLEAMTNREGQRKEHPIEGKIFGVMPKVIQRINEKIERLLTIRKKAIQLAEKEYPSVQRLDIYRELLTTDILNEDETEIFSTYLMIN